MPAATAIPPAGGGAAMAERVHRPPWTCRLHLWHRWRTHRASDGGGDYGSQYQECIDCGKYRDVPIGGGIVG
jgi:hypothetical protein